MAPVYGTPYPVTPGVSAVLAPNPSPFTLHGTQTFLVDGDALAIIDPGPASDEHVEAVLAAVGGRR